MTTTKNQSQERDFYVKSVAIEWDALIINFVSDWTEKKKTMPLTEKWIKYKTWIKNVLGMAEYNPDNIWKDIKDGWILHDCVKDLAAEAKAKEEIVANEWKNVFWEEAVSSDPIDTL